MNERLAAWVKALRSGEYSQASQALVKNIIDGEGYCCLGVLCDVLPEYSRDGYAFMSDGQTYRAEPRADTFTSLGFKKAITRSRLTGPAGKCLSEMVCGEILSIENVFISLNDSFGCTFNEIADFIESNLGVLLEGPDRATGA